MLIIVTAFQSNASAPRPGSTLGRDMFYTWNVTSARETLIRMEINFAFRGFRTYQCRCPNIEPYIDFVIQIDEADYELVKIALGSVRIFFADQDQLNAISDVDLRKLLRMPIDDVEEWEYALSSPPRKTPLIKHNK